MRKKMDNKGFSLVELIIVIAIMAVLMGVLAPQFIKYVEQGRKATDIQNAEMIRDSILADIADGTLTGDATGATFIDYEASPDTGKVCASAIATAPKAVGTATGVAPGDSFIVDYNAITGKCEVKLGGYNLSDATVAGYYKKGLKADGTNP